MNSILGANWRTTLSGWSAILASAIAIKPELVAFLPDTARSYVTGIAGLIAVVSGGTFAAQAKDRNVTGGTVANDYTTPNILRLFVLAAIPAFAFALAGCAWITAHQAQIDATASVLGDRAATIAEQTLINVAADAVDGDNADFLDSVAKGLRANETTIVNANDVTRIATIWSPGNAQWQQLAGKLGTLTGQALAAKGDSNSAVVVESIATGLNIAAANARAK